jgi:excisionase family DNA binding protein
VAGGTGTIGSKEMMENHLLDVKEVAELLNLVPGSIYHKISRGEIPVVRLSARCVRFRRSDIDQWIAERVVDAKTINVPASRRGK